jgi:hypothetical protein
VQDVIAAAKAKPGSLSFASAGNGTSPHMAGELFKIATSTDLTHVPYKGSGPALTDVVAGNVPLIFDTMLVLGGQIKAGKLRPIAVAAPKRIASLPNVPTFAEVGVPGFEVASWQAVFAPAGTPKPIVQRFNAEIAKVSRCPTCRAASRSSASIRRRGRRSSLAISEVRDREVGEGREGREHQARLIRPRPRPPRSSTQSHRIRPARAIFSWCSFGSSASTSNVAGTHSAHWLTSLCSVSWESTSKMITAPRPSFV